MMIRKAYLVLFAVMLISSHAVFANDTSANSDVKWYFDIDEAQKLASDANRLVIVVEFNNDFLEAPSKEDLDNYRFHVIDEKGETWLEANAVLVAKNIGRPKNLIFENANRNKNLRKVRPRGRNPEPETEEKEEQDEETAEGEGDKDEGEIEEEERSISDCVTWFCSPDGYVLGMMVGYPTTKQFFQNAKFGNEILMASGELKFSELSELQKRIVTEPDQIVFNTHFQLPNGSRKGNARIALIKQLIIAANQTRVEQLKTRLGDMLNLQAANKFAAFENDVYHMILFHVPDLQHSEARGLFWNSLGHEIWEVDTGPIEAWIELQKLEKMVMVVSVRPPGEKNTKWPPKSASGRLKRFARSSAHLETTIPGICWAAKQINPKAKLKLPIGAQPTFFVSTSNGDKFFSLSNRNDRRELENQLSPIVGLEIQRK